MQLEDMTTFIVNPSAGHGKCERRWLELQKKIDGRYPFDVIYTKQRGEAESVARNACERGVKRIFIVGGDGTINEVINGVKDSPVELGVIPFGTGNDLAKTLDITSKIDVLENMLLHPEQWQTKALNVAEINDRLFVNACGIGFDGRVAKNVNDNRLMKQLGALGYFIGAMTTLFSFSPMKIDLSIDGEEYSIENGWMLAVGNGPYYGGGMMICPSASMEDDFLDLCIVANLTKPKLLRFLPMVYSGKHTRLTEYVTFRKGKNITINCHGEGISHADGELIESTQLDIKLCCYKIKWLVMS